MSWDVCKTCSSPIRAEVDAMLDRGVFLRDISAQTGISRSALSRHNRKCRSKRRVEEYKNASKGEGRLFVHWLGAPEIARTDWRPQDCVLEISYEKKPSPPMLTRDEAQELKQSMENRPAAAAIVPLEIKGDVITFDSEPAEEISCTRAAEQIPIQQKPESPGGGMSDLLATIRNSLRGRRCG
jgi:hypothetical protein